VRPVLLISALLLAVAPWQQGGAAERDDIVPDALLRDPISREVREVIEGAVFVGEKRGVAFRGHRQIYEYLLNHLDFASQLARALDLSDYVIERTGTGTYEATTPRGGRAQLRVVHADGERRVVLARGKYGQAVAVLQYASFDLGGQTYIVSDLYGYLRADNPILGVLLPLWSSLVDRRVDQVFQSVARLSERAYEAPAAFYRTLLGHPELPSERLLEFGDILDQLVRQEAMASSSPPS
jgi:hypothetical protein